MITEDFQPHLIEINRHPGLGIYSPVSISVCGGVCEDMIRGIRLVFKINLIHYINYITIY